MFKVGDRVRDISPHGTGLGHSAGTIVGREHDTWVIDWDATPYGRINWHDDQIELLPSTGPVRTVTRREIVPGTYGCVEVDVHSFGMNVVADFSGGKCTPEELREAAHLFNQLAEVLEENK